MEKLFRSVTVISLLFAWACARSEAQDTPQNSTVTSQVDTSIKAQAGSQESRLALDQSEDKKNKKISLSASLRESSNLISRGNPGSERQTQLDLTAGVSISNWGKLSVNQGISKSHQQAEDLDVTNTKFGLRHNKIRIHRDADIQDGIYLKLPANRQTREKDRLRLAIGIENFIDIRLGQGPILISNRILLNKNFHDFSVNANGVPTVEWSLNEGVTIGADLSKVINLSVDFSYITSRTYRATTKSRLDISEEVGFQILPNLALSLGHTNGDDLVGSTERSSNVAAFDETTSTIYGVLNVTY